MDYSNKSCAVIDNGLFVELAITLAKSFGKVFYYSPWENSFPLSREMAVGKGLPNVTRVDDPHDPDFIESIDLWVFPDIYHEGFQLDLEERGKRVWGSRRGTELEVYRGDAKRHFSSLGLPVIQFEEVFGFASLRKYLKEHEDVWVYLEKTRGDCETFHSPNYKLIEPKLDELEHNLGAIKYTIKFLVAPNVDKCVESGWDGYCVDGQYPKKSFTGVEIKDKGYIIFFKDTNKMAPEVMQYLDAISPTLAQYHYRNFMSTENRIGKESDIGKFNMTKNYMKLDSGLISYMNDFCARLGSPPNEIYQLQIDNLSDIIWYGAEGILIEPICPKKVGAELLIHSAFADKNWQAIGIPEDKREYFKFRNLTIINNEYYVVPMSVGCPEVGAVIGLGDSIEEAVDQCKENAKDLQGYYLDVFEDSLEEAQAEIDKLKEMGIDILDGV